MEALVVKDLRKDYGKLHALNGVSFSVHEGELFGLLGPNGAGKSTLIKIIPGTVKSNGGTVSLFGKPVDRKLIGIVPQDDSLYSELTVKENLMFFGSLYGVSKDKLNKVSNQLITMLGLKNKKNALTKTLSGGMRKRLNIGCSIMHEPKLLIMDEPTVGLDPESRRLVWKIIRDIHNRGVTIIITTHYMDEADMLCDRVAIITNGVVAAIGSPDELRDSAGEDVIEIETKSGQLDALLKFSEIIPDVTSVDIVYKTLRIKTFEAEAILPKIIKYSQKIGEELTNVNVRKATLEDAFVILTGGTAEIKKSNKKLSGIPKVEEWKK